MILGQNSDLEMKRMIKKWVLRITFVALISIVTIVLTILNPGVLYANKTEFGNFTVYHNSELSGDFETLINDAHQSLKKSELYDDDFKIRMCLNDGSYYPAFVEMLFGRAFGWGGHNLTVFYGEANYEENYTEINGYRWNLKQLFAHELTHCYQVNYFGFWNSNPIADFPIWKWEGYAEYVSRKEGNQKNLVSNIKRYRQSIEKGKNSWSIEFSDGTMAPKDYYENWMLLQYCLEVKGMNYSGVLETELDREVLFAEMDKWYQWQVGEN